MHAQISRENTELRKGKKYKGILVIDPTDT